ncbi:hypothetical protein A2U01_0081046, partial [Trifolium medium]|nr:hypothetical protein [Trifolium medium]
KSVSGLHWARGALIPTPGAILACLRKSVPGLGAGRAYPLRQAQASLTG